MNNRVLFGRFSGFPAEPRERIGGVLDNAPFDIKCGDEEFPAILFLENPERLVYRATPATLKEWTIEKTTGKAGLKVNQAGDEIVV